MASTASVWRRVIIATATGMLLNRVARLRDGMSGYGRVSRVSPVHTAIRNCTRDEGGPFEVGNQVLISKTFTDEPSPTRDSIRIPPRTVCETTIRAFVLSRSQLISSLLLLKPQRSEMLIKESATLGERSSDSGDSVSKMNWKMRHALKDLQIGFHPRLT